MLSSILIPLGFFAMIIVIYYLNLRKKERMALLQMDKDISVFEGTKKQDCSSPRALKWGLFFVAIGLGIIVGKILESIGVEEEVAYFSMILIFGGAAMIISYVMDFNKAKKEDKETKQIEN